ncbi:MAG: hypothetical protein IKE53_08650 [Clostridiales bacterium]|nr:hypothetical protein [Clostridiales bacterium]
MNRLESFRFGNLRRKRLKLGILILAIVVILSLTILLLTALFGFRAELVTLSLTTQMENAQYKGTGINLDYIPNVNLIRNPSFEKESAYYSLTVLDSEGKSLFFSPEDVLASKINTSRAIGAPVRVVSIDGSGSMQLRYEGRITGFESARLGQISPIEMEMSANIDKTVIKTVCLQNTVAALTESGTILADITSEQLIKAYDGGNVSFADISCNGSSIFAVTGDGVVFSSPDGRSFMEMGPEDRDGSMSVVSCAATSNNLTVLTSDHKLFVYENGRYYPITLPVSSKPVVIDSAGDTTIVILEDNTILRSTGGLIYSVEDTGDIYSDRNVSSLVCHQDQVYILNDDGSITAIADDGSCRLLSATMDSRDLAREITVTDNGQIIVLTNDKTAMIVSDKTGEAVSISSENNGISGIYPCTNNRIIFAMDDELYTSSVLSDFTLENSAPDDAITMGDICFIETSNSYTSLSVTDGNDWSLSPDEGVWDAYGTGTSIELSPDPYDGANSVRMTGSTHNIHVMSQKLPGTARDNFASDKFYKVSVYIKAEEGRAAPGTVNLWLDGETFGRQGVKCRKLKNNYTEYSAVFIVNDYMISDEEIRFNVSFEGVGSILIDHIYVGPDSIGDSDIPESFSSAIIAGAPSAIRLNNLGIGSNGFSGSVLYGISELSTGASYTDSEGTTYQVSDVRSLEKSLRLTRDAGADPWFVLGSYTTPEQVNNIIAYMCGSVSSEYGTIRINNGTALPWSRQFEHVYIEINDTEDCFVSDVQRGSFVDFVIGMITQSEFYTDIKDKVVFIDGMRYDGGTMLSSADAHCSGMLLTSVQDDGKTYLQNLSEVYEEVQYKAPRVTTGMDMGEFISSLDFNGSFNLAQYITAVLGEDSISTEMAMINCRTSFKPALYEDENVFEKGEEMIMALNMLSLIKDFAGSDRMYVNVADPMRSDSGQSAESFLADCSTAQFDRDNSTYMVVTNTSDSLKQFLMYNAGQSFLSSSVDRYSSDGRHLTTMRLSNSYRRYNLQPGESLIVITNR